jgi:hypothetical protein
MARFLSPEWVEEWNVALGSVPLPDPGPDAGLAMADGHVTVVQEVLGTPDGDIRLVMHIDAGTVRLDLDSSPEDEGLGIDGDDGSGKDGRRTSPDVTIVLGYDDAAAMSRGEVSPAEALTAGRIRVRGDLSALAATQQLLNDVRNASEGRIPPTTY